MKKEQKERIVDELKEILTSNTSCYLVDYKRMPVAQAVELRKLLRAHSGSIRVIKNRLALRALQDGCPEELKPHFRNSTALAYTSGNPLVLGRVIRDFSAGGKVLAVKAGILEGHYLAPERFDEIVGIGSREEILGRFAGLMAAPLTKLLRTLQAPLSNLGLVLGQLKNKSKT